MVVKNYFRRLQFTPGAILDPNTSGTEPYGLKNEDVKRKFVKTQYLKGHYPYP